MKVLVAVDGSKYTSLCLRAAAHICRPLDAEIYVMTVIPNLADIDLELSPSDRETMNEGFEKRGQALLDRAKEELESYGIRKIATVIATGEEIATQILNFAEKEKVNLIVLGAKGIGEEARFLIGSVAERVVKHSPCCVFVAKKECMEYCGTP